MKKIFERPQVFKAARPIFCPGCGYGIFSRILREEYEAAGVKDNAVAVIGGGCHQSIREFLDVDKVQALHGRAPAVAVGVIKARPDCFVFTIQGDGDMLNEGISELVHLAARGENATTFLMNNAAIAETGGQMACSSILGQITPTSPWGRKQPEHGYPIPLAEMVCALPGVGYVARISVHDPAFVVRGQRCIRDAFRTNLAGAGFAFVEVLSLCPTGWNMTPVEAIKWSEEQFQKTFPVGVLKDTAAQARELVPPGAGKSKA